MCLHFFIGCYDYRRTARFRQGVHFSIIQVLFADHMHRRSEVHNKFSFLKCKSGCRQAPIFRRWEEWCFIFLLYFWYTLVQLPRCFAGTLFLPLCLFLRPILKFWSIGVTLMRFTSANHSERRILVSNVSVTCNVLLCILHIGSVSVCLSSSEKSMKTSAAPYPGIRNPIVVYSMSKRLQRVSPFYDAAHASSTWLLHFCHHSFWTFR